VPTYQYRCTECGEDLEVVQKFSDEPLTVCPACQGSLRKVFSPVGIVFKGSGFYRTDSRKGSGSGDSGDGAKKDKEPVGAKSADSSAADSGKSAANGSAGSAGSDSSSGSSGSSSSGSSSGSSSSGKSEKSSSSTPPAASKAG
jgi:putative FmdB family regulatory protein